MYTPIAKQTLKLIFTFSALFIFSSTSILAKATFELPVKFVRFEAKVVNDMVQLRWLTESEYNNEFFTVERSHDGVNWEGLADLEGIGTAPGEGTYEYYDENPLLGESLYRIKQNDFGGEIDYSHQEPITFTGFTGPDEVALDVYPNPAPGEIVSINSDIDLTFSTVKMLDIAGKEIGIEVDVNDTEMTVRAMKPTPGMYFLMIQVGPKSIVKQIKFE